MILIEQVQEQTNFIWSLCWCKP